MPTRRQVLGFGCLAPLAFRWRPAPATTIPEPGPSDTCPVCGMHVAKYPEWTASVLFTDGTAAHFDGAKCMFRFVLAPQRYARGRAPGDIAAAVVKDYYDLARVDARSALYVVGSDVLGPMGHELVPLASRTAVDDYRRDHGGGATVGFAEVTEGLLDQLDRGTLPVPQ